MTSVAGTVAVTTTSVPARAKIKKLTAAEVAAVGQLKALRAERAAADRKIKALEAVLKPIGEGTNVKIGTSRNGDAIVEFGDGTWNGTDEKLLAEAFPEAFAATRVSKPYVTVKPL